MGLTIIGDSNMPSPSANSPEAAAEEFFINRQFLGNFAPKPPIARWRPDQRLRFEKELKRLEKERSKQSATAVEQAGKRPVEAQVVQTY